MCRNRLAKVIKQILLHFCCQALAPAEKTVPKGSRASGIQWTFWYAAKGGIISDSDNRENTLIESSCNLIRVTIPLWFEPEGWLLLDSQLPLGMCFVEVFELLSSKSEPDQVCFGSVHQMGMIHTHGSWRDAGKARFEKNHLLQTLCLLSLSLSSWFWLWHYDEVQDWSNKQSLTIKIRCRNLRKSHPEAFLLDRRM